MSRFPIRSAPGVLLALAICSTLLAAAPSAPSAHGQRSVFQTAHDLLQAAYPELFGKDCFLEFTTGQSVDSTWQAIIGLDFRIREHSYDDTRVRLSAKTGERLPSEPNLTLLYGQFVFDERERILEASTVGSGILNAGKNRAFAQLLSANPDWTDERVSQEFQRAGGEFGLNDRQAFLKKAHLERFDQAFGQFKIETLEFVRPAEGEECAGWGATLRVHLPDGSRPSYLLNFEPFGAKLTFLKMKGAIVVHRGSPG